jgi:hypothetical protein
MQVLKARQGLKQVELRAQDKARQWPTALAQTKRKGLRKGLKARRGKGNESKQIKGSRLGKAS